MLYAHARGCVIGKVLLSVSVGLFFVAGCTGGGANANPPPPTANPELALQEVIEPWKSMNLPIDGAVVLSTSGRGLLVRFPAVESGDYEIVHAALVQALLDQGWKELDTSKYPASVNSALEKEEVTIDITSRSRDGRPQANLALL